VYSWVDAGDLDARVRLVTAVDADQEDCDVFDEARVAERPGIDGADAGDLICECRDELLGLGVAAGDEYVRVERDGAGARSHPRSQRMFHRSVSSPGGQRRGVADVRLLGWPCGGMARAASQLVG